MSVGSALGGLVFVVVGSLGALNYRGMTTWHVRTTFRIMSGAEVLLRRVPPWSSLLRRPVEQRIATQVRRERLMGVVFVLVGTTVVIGSFGGLIHSFLR